MNRRTFLGVCSSSLAISIAGCLTEEPEEGDKHAYTREKWNVVLYNESAKSESLAVTITDSGGDVVFSDTIEVDPDTDRFTGVELDTGVQYNRAYRFEAARPEDEVVSTETVVKCGNVYISITDTD